MNQLLVDVLRVRIRSAVAASRAIDAIAHEGLKGRIREMFIDDLVTPLLPSFAGVGTGKIIDCEGGQSRECDVVIYDRDTMPPFRFGQRDALFPIESVLYSIEVKTTLTANELRDATLKAKLIKELKNLPPRYATGEGYDTVLRAFPDSLRPAPVCCVFAFGSDLTGATKTELQRYEEIPDNRKEGVPYLGALCVVDRAIHWFGNGRADSVDAWQTAVADSQGREVLVFLGCLLDSIPLMRLKRGYPAWSNYVYP